MGIMDQFLGVSPPNDEPDKKDSNFADKATNVLFTCRDLLRFVKVSQTLDDKRNLTHVPLY